jgi:ribosome maturation factor RimP
MTQRENVADTTNQLIQQISTLIEPHGYEVVHIEALTQRQKTLRVFIDFSKANGQRIGVEDCAKVSHLLDEPLENEPLMERIFKGTYELEVSSPGVDRPLRKADDYNRFAGSEIRVNVFRPLTAKELENDAYQAKNPKQKNFIGKLIGLKNQNVMLDISGMTIAIPFDLITKANLEPQFDETMTKH